MKRYIVPLLAVAACFMFKGLGHAGVSIDAPFDIFEPNHRIAISVSTSAWTEITVSTHTRARNQTGIIMNNPTANNAAINCTMDEAAPTIAIATGEYEIGDGENIIIPTSKKLYCVSLHTSAETIFAKKAGQ